MTLFKCFLFKSAFEHGDFSPFFKLALYKCNIIIIIIIIINIIIILETFDLMHPHTALYDF